MQYNFCALFNDILLDKYNSILTKLFLKNLKKEKSLTFFLAIIYIYIYIHIMYSIVYTVYCLKKKMFVNICIYNHSEVYKKRQMYE